MNDATSSLPLPGQVGVYSKTRWDPDSFIMVVLVVVELIFAYSSVVVVVGGHCSKFIYTNSIWSF